MGQDPTDEEIFQMIADVDDDGSNEIDFGEFCKVISKQKSDKAGQSDETDTSAPRAAPRRGFTRFFLCAAETRC